MKHLKDFLENKLKHGWPQKMSHACYDDVIEDNDLLVHFHNGDYDHLFYNNTEQRGLSQPIIDENTEVPEN